MVTQNGNGKVYKIYEIPFLHRKNHPVLQISPTFLLDFLRQKANRCLCSPRNLLLCEQFPLPHIRAQLVTESAFSLRTTFPSSRKAFPSMRKNTPDSSSADVFVVDEKAHIRVNTFRGKICGKGNKNYIRR